MSAQMHTSGAIPTTSGRSWTRGPSIAGQLIARAKWHKSCTHEKQPEDFKVRYLVDLVGHTYPKQSPPVLAMHKKPVD